MQFIDPERRTPPESIVPMINVVFLLLIFFLMTAQIAPPEPFPVAPPSAVSDSQADGDLILYVNADGLIAFQDIEGEDTALLTLQHALDRHCKVESCASATPPVLLRADGDVSAETIAALLPKLGSAGFTAVQLITALD
ncbi:biopolymer transporter ExbD [Pacificibacter sp. AS14]|uniref:ExbD/TolR family protein n=1 Tax=Pacificibacter sp. AS14 TaxID=3135785 RepID=UPI0031757ABC